MFVSFSLRNSCILITGDCAIFFLCLLMFLMSTYSCYVILCIHVKDFVSMLKRFFMSAFLMSVLGFKICKWGSYCNRACKQRRSALEISKLDYDFLKTRYSSNSFGENGYNSPVRLFFVYLLKDSHCLEGRNFLL